MERVLVLAAPMGSIGGIQRYTETLFSAAAEILGPNNVRLLAVPSEPKTRPDGTVSLDRVTKFRFLVAGIWMAIRWRPTLVICAHIGVAPVARAINKLLGIPYWLVLYGIEVWGDLPAAKRRGLQSADRLVSISRFTLDTVVARHAVGVSDAVLLPPAFVNGSAAPDPKQGRTLLDPMRPTVLTVSRLASSERYKGHDVILEAWPMVLQHVPDAVYLIVGEGDDRPRLEARASELGIAGSVYFAGSVTNDELYSCYEGCHVFAMPARTEVGTSTPRGEGFGIVFLEAMMHGKPVVGPAFGAPAEFIRSGEHGLLVDPSQPGEVAAALVELLGDPERGRLMGRRGREWVASQYSYEAFRQRLRNALLVQSSIH